MSSRHCVQICLPFMAAFLAPTQHSGFRVPVFSNNRNALFAEGLERVFSWNSCSLPFSPNSALGTQMPLLKGVKTRRPHVFANATITVDEAIRVPIGLGSQSDVLLCEEQTNILNCVTALALEVTASAPSSFTICPSFDVRQCRLPRRVLRIRAFPDGFAFHEGNLFTEAHSSTLTRKLVCFRLVTITQTLESKWHY